MGELNEAYFNEVLKPEVDAIQKLWMDIFNQQNLIIKRLAKL